MDKREAVARAIYEAVYGGPEQVPGSWGSWLKEADGAIAACEAWDREQGNRLVRIVRRERVPFDIEEPGA